MCGDANSTHEQKPRLSLRQRRNGISDFSLVTLSRTSPAVMRRLRPCVPRRPAPRRSCSARPVRVILILRCPLVSFLVCVAHSRHSYSASPVRVILILRCLLVSFLFCVAHSCHSYSASPTRVILILRRPLVSFLFCVARSRHFCSTRPVSSLSGSGSVSGCKR